MRSILGEERLGSGLVTVDFCCERLTFSQPDASIQFCLEELILALYVQHSIVPSSESCRLALMSHVCSN